MTRWRAILLAGVLSMGMISIGILLGGCAVRAPVSSTVASAPETVSEPLPGAVEYWEPSVPIYPAATARSEGPGQRTYIQVKGEEAAKVLAWYQAALQENGWQTEPTDLPPEMMLLFSREGQYLSLSGRDASEGERSVIWFHLRTTREVTQDEALLIARETHRAPVDWTATLMRDYESERYGAGIKHPVWMVKASPGNDAVWVDALTAEPFRIRE